MSNSVDSPTVIDSRYFVVKDLKHGERGSLYKVQSLTEPDRFFALKLVGVLQKSSNIVRKIENYIKSEFSLLKSLNHPNVVKVYDFGFDHQLSSYYFTMEYIDGMNLFDFFHQEDSLADFGEVIRQILYGLHFLHSNRIIHYDLKPANILISKQNGAYSIKLLDFGLAEINQLSNSPRIKNNILYLSPELYTQSNEISERIDIYSLGVSLLHSISPLVKENLSELTNEEINQLDKRSLEQGVLLKSISSEKIRRFINGLIEKTPKLRPANAKEALHSLNQILNTNYPLPKVATHDSFQNNSRFLIRNDIVNATINYFGNYRAPNKKSTIIITGERGSGKSRIAEQLHFNFSCLFHKTLLINQSDSQKLFGIVIHLIDQIYLSSSSYFNADMNKFYSLLNKINRNVRNSSHYQTLFVDIFSFISECCSYRPLTIIFDEFELYDLYSQQFIYYLISHADEKLKLKMVVLATTNQLSGREESAFNGLKDSEKVEFFQILPLNIQEVRYIRYFLLGKSETFSASFDDLLHQHGGSNFRHLMLIFDNLISSGAITQRDDVYHLENEAKLLKVIKMGSLKLKQNVLKQLDKEELEVLLLITLMTSPLTEFELSNLLKCNRVPEILLKLSKLCLIVGVRKDQFTIEYRLYSSQTTLAIFSFVKYELVKKCMEAINQAGYLKGFAEDFYLAVMGKKPLKIETITLILDELKIPYKQYAFLVLLDKIEAEYHSYSLEVKALILLYKIDTTLLLGEVSGSLKKMGDFYQTIECVENSKIKIDLVAKAIVMLDRQNRYKQALFLQNSYSVQLLNAQGWDYFFGFNFKMLKAVINSGHRTSAQQIVKSLSGLFEKSFYEQISPYEAVLKAFMMTKATASFNYQIKEILERVVSGDIVVSVELRFEASYYYFLLVQKFKQKLLVGWSEYLEQLLLLADNKEYKYYYTNLLYIKHQFFYDNSDYRKSLAVVKKQISIAISINHDDLPMYYLNKALIETELLSPANEIITTLKDALDAARFSNNFAAIILALVNLTNCYTYSGDFGQAIRYWQETYGNFRYCQIKDRMSVIRKLVKNGLFLMEKKKLIDKIDKLYHDKYLTGDEFLYAAKTIEQYEFELIHKTNYTINRGLTVYGSNLPGFLLQYINENRKLPTHDEFNRLLSKNIARKPFVRISSRIVKYMLAPDLNLLEKNLLMLKKSYQLGYELDTFYHLVPLLEYLFMIKNISKQTLNLISLLKEIINALFDKMNSEQKAFFMLTYEYTKAEKTLNRFNSLNQKNS